jgi:hypothetical protein
MSYNVCKLRNLIKSQLKQFPRQYHLLLTKNKLRASRFTLPSKIGSKNLFIFSGLFGASYYGLKSFDQNDLLNFIRSISSGIFAYCKEDSSKNQRTKHYERSIDEKKNDENKDVFDWAQFLKLLLKEKFYFFTAVCVSL